MSYFLKPCLAFLIIFSALLTGCGASVPTIKPFKMDIQQGNVVTSKMLLQLKPGMTKSQVKFIMGTPLVVDSFHTNRWDYFYQMRKAGTVQEQRRVILEFEKDALVRVRGDVVPEGTAGAATGEPDKISAPITVAPKAKEEGILDKLKFWKKDAKPAEAKPEVKPELAKPELVQPEAKTPEVLPEINLKAPASDALGGNNGGAAGDAPSLLAVPIEVAPAQDLPAVEMPKVETPAVEVPKVAAPKVEPPKVEPPKVEPIKAEPVKVEPVKPEPPKPAPIKAVEPANAAEPFSFRMDKNLNTNNTEAPQIEVVPPEVQNAAKPKKVESAPLPDESEPSFFDRMLEKIGF